MANDGGQTLPRIARAEHIGPDDTGDNIQAKRTANYVWDGADWQRMTQPGGGQVEGTVASGVTDTGNPVKMGGVYNSTNPTVATGQRVDLQTDSRGNLKVIPASGSNIASFGPDNADAVATTATADKQRIISRNSVFNGTTWDRMYGDSTNGLWVNVKQQAPATPPKASDEYGITAVSDDGTYKYFWFEADDADYYIMRKNKTTSVFTFTKGTGSYTTVYQSEILGPSGSPTWGTRGATF